MKCKRCGNPIRLLRSGAVAPHYKNPSSFFWVLCPASGMLQGHPDHPDPLIAPDVSRDTLERGYIDWPEPDQTYGAVD